jgi:hypothetical protein
VRLVIPPFDVTGIELNSSGGPSRSTSGLNFVTEIPVDAGGVDPEGRSAFHFQQLRLGIVVPVDGDSVLFHFSIRSYDADTDLRSFLSQAGKNGPGDSVKNLPGVSRHHDSFAKDPKFRPRLPAVAREEP